MKFPRKFILEITVFVSGALVMVYEIIGSRILAPYIGTSTYTWTSLIGVILAALSLGYWLGGKTADRKPQIGVLAAVLFFAGGLVAVTIVVKEPVLILLGASTFPIELKAVAAAVLLFAPASVLMGFVTPYAVKLKTRELEKTGETVGKLYALSTIGSIVGTFAAGFLLIPFVGSTRSLYIIATSLLALSVLLAPFSVSRKNIAIIVVFVLGIVVNESLALYLRSSNGFYDFDTRYNRVQIFETNHRENNRPIRAMRIDPSYFQSSMYLDSDELTSEYAKFYHLIRVLKPNFTHTLMIGGAGYSFPKDYLNKYPQATMDVVEIDPGMTEIAHRFFRLNENSRLKIFHEDGRVFLNSAPSEKYDAVFIDAFTSMFSVPFQLTTTEAIQEIKRVLKPGGVVIANIGGAIEGRHSRFLWAEFATYNRIFSSVSLFAVSPETSKNVPQNIILVAGAYDLPVMLNQAETLCKEIEDGNSCKVINPDKRNSQQVLVDDLAPVESLNR